MIGSVGYSIESKATRLCPLSRPSLRQVSLAWTRGGIIQKRDLSTPLVCERFPALVLCLYLEQHPPRCGHCPRAYSLPACHFASQKEVSRCLQDILFKFKPDSPGLKCPGCGGEAAFPPKTTACQFEQATAAPT
jgi:hypothetical protein